MGSRHHHAILKLATLAGREENEVAGNISIVQKNRDHRTHSPAARRVAQEKVGKN